MRGDQDHPQTIANQHHSYFRCVSEGGEKFSMPWIIPPGSMPHGFTDWRGHNSLQYILQGELHTSFNITVRSLTSCWCWLSWGTLLRREGREREHRQTLRISRIRVSDIPCYRDEGRAQPQGSIL